MTRILTLVFLLTLPSLAQAQTATPTTKLGWDQEGQSLANASGATYQLYIDGGTATPLPNVACAQNGPSTVSCSAPLPALTAGSHVIRLSQTLGGAESGQSASLNFTFVIVVTPTNLRVIGDSE